MTVLTMMPADVDLDVHVEQQTDLAGGMAAAVFDSPARIYRYLLTRIWDPTVPPAVFVMLNPSTADVMSVAPDKMRAWVFARLTMTKLPVSTQLGSIHGKSANIWGPSRTRSAWPCGEKEFRSEMVGECLSMTRLSRICTQRVERSSRSGTNFSSARSWSEKASTGRARNVGAQLTTPGYRSILTKSSGGTPKDEVRRQWHGTWAFPKIGSCRSFTITTCVPETASTSWTPTRRSELSPSTGKGTLRRTSTRHWGFRSGLSARHSGSWASPRRTVGRLAVRDASAWERVARTLGCALKTPTRWQSCDKQAASSPNTDWSWRGILVVRCYPGKPSITSTTMGTTTGSRTCNFGLASMGGATSSSAAIAGPIAFSQHLSLNNPYGLAS